MMKIFKENFLIFALFALAITMHTADWKYKKTIALVPALEARIDNINEKLNKKINEREAYLISRIEEENRALGKHTEQPHAFGGDYEETNERYIRHPKP